MSFRPSFTLCVRVLGAETCVAHAADDFEVVIPAECLGHPAFRTEKTFAVIAPCLQVSWFRTVLHESQNRTCGLHMMAAHHRIDRPVVRSAPGDCAGIHRLEGETGTLCEA